MKKTLVRAALAVCLLGTVCGPVLTSALAADIVDEKPKVSMAVAKPLVEAEKLANAKDYEGALAKIKEAQSVPIRSAYDDYAINQFIAYVAVSRNDYATALATYEIMSNSPAELPGDKAGTRYNLVMLEYQAKNYAKTIQYGELLQTMNGIDQQTASALVQAYYYSNEFAKAQTLAQKWVDVALVAKKPPDQNMLGILFSAQAKSENRAGAAKTLELLAQYYSSPAEWDQLIDVALGTPGITNVEGLDLFRLRWAAAAMSKGDDYTLMATIASQLGYPGEARTVLQQGVQMGKLSSSGGAGPAFQQARTQAAADEKLIPAFAAEAAKSSTGEKEEKLAETYYGYGRYADSEAAARLAISKNGLRDPGQAHVLLGMNLVNLGKYAEAADEFQSVTTGSAARMQAVHLWTIFAKHKLQETMPATPAAAPAAAPAPAAATPAAQ